MLSKQRQREVAYEAFSTIVDPAYKAYHDELKRIEEGPAEGIPIFKGTREALNNL